MSRPASARFAPGNSVERRLLTCRMKNHEQPLFRSTSRAVAWSPRPRSYTPSSRVSDRLPGDEILTDALDQPAPGLPVMMSLLHIGDEDRTFRIREHDFGLGETRAKYRPIPSGCRPCRRRPPPHPSCLHLLPDLRRGAALMRCRIVRVVELVDLKPARFPGDALGHILIIFPMAFGHVRTGDHDFRADCAEMGYFFVAHFVGDDELQIVPSASPTSARARPVLPAVASTSSAAGEVRRIRLQRSSTPRCDP